MKKNPRQITKKRLAALDEYMEEFGDLSGITYFVDEKRYVTGNQRMAIIGMSEHPVIEQAFDTPQADGTVARGYFLHSGHRFDYRAVSGWTVEKAERAMFIANHAGGSDDIDALANEWPVDQLIDMGFDDEFLRDQGKLYGAVLNMIESEKEPPVDAEPQINSAEALREKWGVEYGSLWAIGNHILKIGNSTSTEDVADLMRGLKATLIFTDPPYGVSIGAKNRLLNSVQKAGRNLTDVEFDDEIAEDLGAMLLSAFTLAKAQLTDDASVFVCSPQGGSLGLMMMMMRDAGLEIRHVLNWVKNSPTFSLGRLDYEYQHEPILFTWNKTHKRYKRGFTTSTWEVDKPRSSKEHPTMKPVELPYNAIINHTDEGDIVLDPFGGSGSTMLPCEQTGRICCMMELTPNYGAVILQRMSDAFPGIEITRLP